MQETTEASCSTPVIVYALAVVLVLSVAALLLSVVAAVVWSIWSETR